MMRINSLKFSTLYALLIVTVCWYVIHLLLNTPTVPDPLLTFSRLVNLLTDDLLLHLLSSLGRIVVATSIALILGITVGLMIGLSQFFNTYLSPIVFVLFPLPKIAFLPILMLLFGLGNQSKIILVALIIVFQIIITVKDSVMNLKKEYFLSIKTMGATRIELFKHIIFPSILPSLFTALRLSIGTSISVLFFAENYATTFGIGYFIMDSWIRIDYIDMYAGIVAISLLGLGLFLLIQLIEQRYLPWVQLEKGTRQSFLD